MPVGIQLVAQPHDDRRLFACARWVWQQLGAPELVGNVSETSGDVEMGRTWDPASPPPLAGEG